MNTMENDMQNDTTERSATAKKSLLDGWNAPPNLVTYSRIVLVVIFLGLYIAAGSWGENNIPMRWAAAVLFIVAASTDKVDGWMARKYNQVTELGKLMDPIADKLLTCATLIVARCSASSVPSGSAGSSSRCFCCVRWASPSCASSSSTRAAR